MTESWFSDELGELMAEFEKEAQTATEGQAHESKTKDGGCNLRELGLTNDSRT